MNDTSKIIALDFNDAKLENFKSWLTKQDYITNQQTQNYVLETLNENQKSDNPVHVLFLINDFIFGVAYQNSYPKIEFNDFVKADLKRIKPIALSSLEVYRSVLIDWIFNHQKSNNQTALAVHQLQNHDNSEYQFPSFTNCVSCIEISDLGFTLGHLFQPLQPKFKAIHQFFKTKYEEKNILKNVAVTKLYLLEECILGFDFQMVNKLEEHFFWNIHLEDQLLLLNRFIFYHPIQYEVDDLLDKINIQGINSLTDDELTFLKKQ